MKLGDLISLPIQAAIKRIEDWGRATGTVQLANKKDSERRTITVPAAFVNYPQLQAGFNTTGGLVRIESRVLLFAGAGITVQVRMAVDGREVKKTGALGVEVQAMPMVHEVVLPAGSHTVKIETKASATINLNQDGTNVGAYGDSDLIIKETLGAD